MEFKAGRTLLEPGSTPEKRKAVADKSRGLVFIKQSADQLIHFCWKNREKNTTDLDLIIFPGDTEFIKIKECTDGRVYMLKFRSCDDHKLFWLQETNSEKDDDLCKKVNETLNNPPSNRASARGGASERSANALAALGSEDMSALGNMDQNQIMQLFSLMNGGSTDMIPQLPLNPSSTTTALSGTGSEETPKRNKEGDSKTSSNLFDAATLNNILTQMPSSSKRSGVDLSRVLNRSNVEKDVKENADKLIPHLPSTSSEPEKELSKTLTTPQFKQAVDWFGSALQSGQLGDALRQFDFPENAVKAADTGDILQFSKALSSTNDSAIDQAINEEANKEENNESQKPQDEDMDLD